MIGSAPEFSVAEFVAVFNQALDVAFPLVIINGELANFKISKNAWVYTDLKDDDASVRCFGSVRVLPGPLEDGMTVQVVARPYLHPQFGFSLQLQSVQPIGQGTIKQAKDMLAEKLNKEGVFDPLRKRPVPYPPSRIALISSVESAGYSDFIKILSQRWPSLRVEVYDVLVQGQDAPRMLIAGLEAANQSAVDAIVIVRGGGSADDLVTFDHEQLVMAVAASRLPIVIGVGHEKDITLAERAADVRASTPSNAAELLVPDKYHEKRALKMGIKNIHQSLSEKVTSASELIKADRPRLNESLARVLESHAALLSYDKRLLLATDPKAMLKKGFVLARSKDGRLLKTTKTAIKEDTFTVEFSDGVIGVEVQ